MQSTEVAMGDLQAPELMSNIQEAPAHHCLQWLSHTGGGSQMLECSSFELPLLPVSCCSAL